MEEKPKQASNQIIWEGHPCWKAMLGQHAKGILSVIVGSAIIYALGYLEAISKAWAYLFLIFGLGAVIFALHLMRRFTVYTITRVRVVKKSGVLNVRKEQARIDMITNIIIDRNLVQRLLGIGDLDIDTANDNSGTLVWWGVKDPDAVEERIDRLRNDLAGEISDDDDDSIYYGRN